MSSTSPLLLLSSRHRQPKRTLNPVSEFSKIAQNASSNSSNDEVQAAALQKWFQGLSPDDKEKAVSFEHPWLASIFRQMYLRNISRGEQVFRLKSQGIHFLDSDRLDDWFECSPQPHDVKFNASKSAEHDLLQHVRLIDTLDYLDSLTLCPLILNDVSHFWDVLRVIAGEQSMKVPCRVSRDPTSKQWSWDYPIYLTQESTLGKWVCAVIERTLWIKFFEKTNIPCKKPGEPAHFIWDSSNTPRASNYHKAKKTLVDYWLGLEEHKRCSILSDLPEMASSFHAEQESYLSQFSALSYGQINIEGDLCPANDVFLQACKSKMEFYKSVESVEHLMENKLMGGFIEFLMCSPLERAGSLMDVIARRVGLRIENSYSEKMAEDMILTEEAEQIKKQGKKARNQPSKKQKLKAKHKHKQKRKLSNASTLSVSTTTSVATTFSASAEEDAETAYARQLAGGIFREMYETFGEVIEENENSTVDSLKFQNSTNRERDIKKDKYFKKNKFKDRDKDKFKEKPEISLDLASLAVCEVIEECEPMEDDEGKGDGFQVVRNKGKNRDRARPLNNFTWDVSETHMDPPVIKPPKIQPQPQWVSVTETHPNSLESDLLPLEIDTNFPPLLLPMPPPPPSPSPSLHSHITTYVTDLNTRVAEQLSDLNELFFAIKQVVQQSYPCSDIFLYGSHSTGLALPTSDLDILILDVPIQDRKAKERYVVALAFQFSMLSWVKGCTPITSALVPVVKLEVVWGQRVVGVDLSFNDGDIGGFGSLDSFYMTRDLLLLYPSMKPLAIIVKSLLRVRNLNESYDGKR